MSNQKRVKTFLGLLESSANDINLGLKALQARQEAHLSPYIQAKSWPGQDYLYIGHLDDLQDQTDGREIQSPRARIISSLIQANGDENYCVGMERALNFEGFVDVLSRFELSLLQRMPAYSMIGPAYADSGELLTSSFTIWQALQHAPQESRILLSA
jgi:hypothetical protein